MAIRHAPEEQAPPDSGKAGPAARREVLATRKPALFVSLDGRFVLRFAERTFDA